MNWRLWRIPLLVSALIAIPFTIYFAPEVAAFIYDTIVFLMSIWLPALLVYLAWPLWFSFARSQYAASVPYVTLELMPGAETPKSAHPMELVFYSLYHRTQVTKKDYVLGRVRLPWSFEVYANAGKVRFFLYLPKSHVEAVTARIRSEYHDIEIDFAPDYAREIPFGAGGMRLAMKEYSLSKPDPYPLKTYASYEAETSKRDVFAELLEEIAHAGKGEHLCISYIVRPHQRDRMSYFDEPRDTLHEDAHHVIAHIVGPKGDTKTLPAQKQAQVAAIEAALKKPSFDCGIRVLYTAPRAAFNEATAQKIPQLFDRFDDENLNGFLAYDPSERMSYFFSELFAIASYLKAHHLMQLYRRRAFFTPPYMGKQFILNTEELATVFHMPSTARVGFLSNRRSVPLEPPENLPV